MDAGRLADIAKAEGDVYTAQRLGYLLDQVGAGAVGAALAPWIASLAPGSCISDPIAPRAMQRRTLAGACS